jgi:hypothetical protein
MCMYVCMYLLQAKAICGGCEGSHERRHSAILVTFAYGGDRGWAKWNGLVQLLVPGSAELDESLWVFQAQRRLETG